MEHDYLLPFLKMINGNGVCAYATRTILVMQEGSMKDTIEPIAIELRLPDFDSDSNGIMVVDRFYDFLSDMNKPDSDGTSTIHGLNEVDDFQWELAKIHVAANDAAYHQLVSHW